MNTETAPWFKFFAQDRLNEAAPMTLAASGLLIRLEARLWLEGSLPADPATLARIAGCDRDEFAGAWPMVAGFFPPHPTMAGRLTHRTLEEQRALANAKRVSFQRAGRSGGLARSQAIANAKALAQADAATESKRVRTANAVTENSSEFSVVSAKKPTESGEDVQVRLGFETVAEPSPPQADEAEVKALVPPPEPLPAADSEPPAPPRSRRREPSAIDLAAYAILRVAEPIVFESVPGIAMTRKQWRDRNMRGAAAFVELGDWPPERVAALLKFAYTNPEAAAFYGQTTMLAKFQEAAPRLTLIRDGKTGNGRSSRRPEREMNLAVR